MCVTPSTYIHVFRKIVDEWFGGRMDRLTESEHRHPNYFKLPFL